MEESNSSLGAGRSFSHYCLLMDIKNLKTQPISTSSGLQLMLLHLRLPLQL